MYQLQTNGKLSLQLLNGRFFKFSSSRHFAVWIIFRLLFFEAAREKFSG